MKLNNISKEVIRLRVGNQYRGNLVQNKNSYTVGKIELAPGKINVYKMLHSDNNIFVENEEERKIFFPDIRWQESIFYSFSYDGLCVRLQDARPLNKIGEPTWSVELSGLNQPIALIDSLASPIVYATSGKQGITLYTVSDAGNAIGKELRKSDGNVSIKSIRATSGDTYLLAGYAEKNSLEPYIQMQAASGSVEWTIPRSKRPDCESGYILAVAGNETTGWLAVGGGSNENDFDTYYPYACAFQGDSKSGSVSWELGRKEFNERGRKEFNDSSYGNLSAAAYDAAREIWIVAGDYHEGGDRTQELGASYFATVSKAGKIIHLESPIKNIIVNRVLAATDGLYLIGEERKAGEGYGVVLKYGLDGDLIWKQTEQPKAFSYYLDAILDEANGAIILAGTIGASNEQGEGGKPYLQSIGISTGKEIWSETFENDFPGTEAIARMTRAPGYGFLLSLAGVNEDGDSLDPYIIARVNECGKLIDHVRRSER